MVTKIATIVDDDVDGTETADYQQWRNFDNLADTTGKEVIEKELETVAAYQS